MTNYIILQGLKTRLEGAKGLWIEELYSVLWAYCTTPRAPTGETPFSLALGFEVVISVEIGLPSTRVEEYQEPDNSDRLRENLDLVEELREWA